MSKPYPLTPFLLLFALLLTGCGLSETPAAPATAKLAKPGTEAPLPVPVITLVAVGDNILHDTVIRAAWQGEGYDFTPMYRFLTPYVQAADVAYVNQEAPMAGPSYPPKGYPNFNAPQEVGRDLAATGFDVVNLANNHIMDTGGQAVHNTLDYLQGQPVLAIGAYDSAEARTQPHIITAKGIRVGFLAYTYGTNGIPVSKGQPYLVGLLEEETVRAEMAALRPQCDILVVSAHWGNEYQMRPNSDQQYWAALFNSLGADVVIGTHPHVIQPMEWITGADGHQTLVAYSLGNFVSSQNKLSTMLGGMLALEMTVGPDGRCQILRCGVMPLVTHYEQNWPSFTVYPLDDYSQALADQHRVRLTDQPVTMTYFSETAASIWGENCLGLQDIKEILGIL